MFHFVRHERPWNREPYIAVIHDGEREWVSRRTRVGPLAFVVTIYSFLTICEDCSIICCRQQRSSRYFKTEDFFREITWWVNRSHLTTGVLLWCLCVVLLLASSNVDSPMEYLTPSPETAEADSPRVIVTMVVSRIDSALPPGKTLPMRGTGATQYQHR